MHPALKKTVLVLVLFAALLVGLPIAGAYIRKGLNTLSRSASGKQESETELTGVLDEEDASFVTLADVNREGVSILPVQDLMETQIPYTDRENTVLSVNRPLIVNEPAPYGKLSAQFLSGDEEREKFTNLVVLYSAYNFGEGVHVQEIEFMDLLYYDSVVLQYRAAITLSDAENNSTRVILTVGHNLDEYIFYITTQVPEYIDYEQDQGETETEWEDAYA